MKMKIYKLNSLMILLIIILSIILPSKCNNAIWMISSLDLDQQYMQKVIENKAPEICDTLPPEKKLFICNYIFKDRNIQSKFNRHIRLNKTAFYNIELGPGCIEHTLSFQHKIEYNEQGIKKQLFPCYGRHEPIRTRWDIDDAFDYFHISGGSNEHEYYIFRHDKHFVNGQDRYVLTDGIEGLNTSRRLNIASGIIRNKDINWEQNSILRLSRNWAVEEIEINFFRQDNQNFASTSKEKKSICDLPYQLKFIVCQLIISPRKTPLHNTVLHKEKFNEESSQCVPKYIKFQYFSNHFDISGRMFPCHGDVKSNELNRWYLMDGYRDLSLLVFMEVPNDEIYVHFYEFYENVHVLDNLFNYDNLVDIESISLHHLIKKLTESDTPTERESVSTGATTSSKKQSKFIIDVIPISEDQTEPPESVSNDSESEMRETAGGDIVLTLTSPSQSHSVDIVPGTSMTEQWSTTQYEHEGSEADTPMVPEEQNIVGEDIIPSTGLQSPTGEITLPSEAHQSTEQTTTQSVRRERTPRCFSFSCFRKHNNNT